MLDSPRLNVDLKYRTIRSADGPLLATAVAG
jgi:hypothetical protein